ncbi:MAG: nucleotidyltransferase domain-containing protein [Phycisphaerales bacterium]|nr:nucleotidyltransferase domain-containing protein [Phycisphaerae bacterium]NNF41911.1 nucleotidyltransferase domain-containing protein [Phycisphaerales bacterium]NNM25527.1 nucleotidyltransferase domain-containing protein [Phycisphaerales bacterium]
MPTFGPSSRDELIAVMTAALVDFPPARAAWLGGSDATDRTDDYSDIDLVVIADDDEVESIFERLEQTLRARFTIDRTWRLPSPTWHGHEQVIHQFAATPHWLVDLVVQQRSAKDRFLETERHGTPLVLFDHDDVVHAVALDRDTHATRLQTRLEAVCARFEILQCLVHKAVARGLDVEAMNAYQGCTLRPLVDLLRIRHCPDRFDFGLRYLERDLPAERYDAIRRLSFPPDPAAISGMQAEAETLFRETLGEIHAERGGG